MPNFISAVTAADVERHASSADLLVVEISRRQVDSGLPGAIVDPLMVISESRQYTAQYADRLILSFGGYDHDSRELFQIPEVCAYFDRLTTAWGFWAHFLCPAVPMLATVASLLAPPRIVTQAGGQSLIRFDPLRLDAVIGRLSSASRALCAFHALGQSRADACHRRLLEAVGKA